MAGPFSRSDRAADPQSSSKTQTASDETTHTRIGTRYLVLERLGRGGTAVVYRVLDASRGGEVALKQLLSASDPVHGPQATAAFEREFCALAQLSHPSVIEVYDYGIDVAGPYYTMELLEGDDLGERAPLPFDVACKLMMEVCSSLSLLHSRRLVHRDISPRNVRCTRQGNAKLIDFGAMVPIGESTQSVGTPAFTAPEVLQRSVLEARTDLFSLGATLYFAVTGRAPFAARTFAQLPEAWSRAPDAPSSLVSGIPPALDALVLSLLQIDVERRPRSAFEVTQRLGAIAGIGHAEPANIAQAYLWTPTLLGRDAAQRRFRQRMRRASGGHGVGLLIESEPGLGRSRLLDAYALEAKTLGATVLRVAGSTAKASAFASAHKLAAQLATALPDAAEQCARAAGVFDMLFETLPSDALDLTGNRLQLLPLARLRGERYALQAALKAWLHRVCQAHPLLIAADDAERIDEASLALLAAIALDARDSHVLLVVSLQNLVQPGALPALDVLRSHCEQVSLAPLTRAETEALFASVFGNVPHVALLSDRIHKIAAGNPRESLGLVRHMIDRQLVRYIDGHWMLPVELAVEDLPADAQDALRARVAMLPPLARHVAETQAIALGGAFRRADYAELVEPSELPGLDDALAILLDKGVLALASDGNLYTLAHHGYRVWLSAKQTAAERMRRHMALAEMCVRTGRPVLSEVHHLLLAGCTERALDRLGTQFNELSDLNAFCEQSGLEPKDLSATLAQAFELAVSLRRSPREIHELARYLTTLSIITDPSHYFRYAPAWLAQLERDSGLTDYHETHSDLSPAQRLQAALARTDARYAATPTDERVYGSEEAIKHVFRYVTTSCVIGLRRRDRQLLSSLPGLIKPFAVMSPTRNALWQAAVAVLETNCKAQRDVSRLRMIDVYNRLLELAGEELPAAKSIRHSQAYGIGMAEVGLGYVTAIRWIEILDQAPMQRVNAMYLRRLLCLYEGDGEGAERHRKQAEMLAIQAGTRQTFDAPLMPELDAQHYAGDLAGVKQVGDRIAQLAAQEPGWVAPHHLAQGYFQRLRGDPQAAKEAFERCMALSDPASTDPPPNLDTWVSAAAAYVAILIELDRPHEARAFALAALEQCAELGIEVLSHNVVRELAVAEAKLSDFARAAERLDALIVKRSAVMPSRLVRDYEARAQVAILARDAHTAAHFIGLIASQCRAGKDTRLLVRYGRLLEQARRAGLSVEPGDATPEPLRSRNRTRVDQVAEVSEVCDAISGIATPDARALRALELLCEASRVTCGELFLSRASGLMHAATLGMAHDPTLDEFVQRYWTQQIADAALLFGTTQLTGANSEIRIDTWANPTGTLYRLLCLQVSAGETLVHVGVAALRAKTTQVSPLSISAIASAISRRLHELGDARGAGAG